MKRLIENEEQFISIFHRSEILWKLFVFVVSFSLPSCFYSLILFSSKIEINKPNLWLIFCMFFIFFAFSLLVTDKICNSRQKITILELQKMLKLKKTQPLIYAFEKNFYQNVVSKYIEFSDEMQTYIFHYNKMITDINHRNEEQKLKKIKEKQQFLIK